MRPRVSRAGRGRWPLLALLALPPRGAGAAQPDALPPWDPRGAPAPPPASAAQPGLPEAPKPAAPPSLTPAPAPGPAPSFEIPPLPRDPNDAPFMRAPNNQISGSPPRTRPDLRPRYSSRRRVAFTLAPAFASFRLPFQGRPGGARYHGAGFGVELDARLARWIWFRAMATHSAHPVGEERVEAEDMSVVTTAPRGTIRATGFGAGPVFALDLGRWLPLIEVGLGGLQIGTPTGVVQGQRGQACRDNGGCDTGLRCSAGNTCEPSLIAQLYFGLAVDVLIRRHFSVGGQFRYYALLTAPGSFPVYLLGTLRVAVRF